MKQSEGPNSVCPKCHSAFECGIAAGKDLCWCFEYPKLTLTIQGKQCFCEKCLKDLIAKQHRQKKSA